MPAVLRSADLCVIRSCMHQCQSPRGWLVAVLFTWSGVCPSVACKVYMLLEGHHAVPVESYWHCGSATAVQHALLSVTTWQVSQRY